ncbi:hypothetical protein CH063_11099, partial [Colletotrichum higginsianum]
MPTNTQTHSAPAPAVSYTVSSSSDNLLTACSPRALTPALVAASRRGIQFSGSPPAFPSPSASSASASPSPSSSSRPRRIMSRTRPPSVPLRSVLLPPVLFFVQGSLGRSPLLP